MQNTANYGFKKPEDHEAFDQQNHANWNMDQIDTQIKNRADELSAHLAENMPHSTASNINYYVNAATGNDNNDGLSSVTAFKTFAKAIGKIPLVVQHTITINVAAGNYNEEIGLYNYIGRGNIIIKGSAALADTHLIVRPLIVGCACNIEISGFKCTTTGNSVSINYCTNVKLTYIKAIEVSVSNGIGVLVYSSKAIIENCEISNKQSRGILATYCSTVYSTNNTGSGNTIAIGSEYTSTVGKSGTQPSGTTAELSNTGGVIR